jgi:monoamine oxidase
MRALSRRSVLKTGVAVGLGALAAQPRAMAAGDADVIVIGAGLSGLMAALILEGEGLRVTVLEGRRRIGGRLFTLDDVPGNPEGGGNGIAEGYARILDMANRLNVGLAPVRERTEPTHDQTAINLRGQTILLKDWAASPLNPFPENYRKMLPWELQWPFLMKANPLKDSASWRDPRYAEHDISIFDFMLKQGLPEPAIELACGTGMLYGTNAYDFSTLAMFHTITWANEQRAIGTAAYAIKGGNQRLPEAMAKAVKGDILFGQTISALQSENERAIAITPDGRRFVAKRVIVTAPFSALRRMRFDPILTSIQARAVAQLGYSTAFQTHFVPTGKFWEEDGLPLSLWTDSLAGRFSALRYAENPNEVTSFLAFVNGAQGEYLDRLDPADAAAAVLAEINRLRPSTKGKLKAVKTVSWQRDVFAGGIYSSWKPGQITAFGDSLAKPHGRIHFAGEHTADVNRGMEGAMESGERVALEVLEML